MSAEVHEWRLPAHALARGQSARFIFRCDGKAVEGFVVNYRGAYYAYVNRCAHVGTPLDLWPNEFFTEDGRHLICSTHGALYRPESGECVAGPCPGARLSRLPVVLDGSTLVVTCPEATG